MKSLFAAALIGASGALWALAAAPALARDPLPTVPSPPASARTVPDTCLGTDCPRIVDPGKINRDCLGTSCAGSRYPPPAVTPARPQDQPGLKAPTRTWLPPMPARPGQTPVGPLTPAPALPR
ncbi:hypothetical protein [Achromobacter sp.]|uniref:hypothetical protein n=1 Tax=Achromobacter sp. TaxID=134375 RepID=UPI00289FA77D|nr:hypothetical protein [Achromobacter sp.]